jgi:hypothetical protein
MIEGLILMVIGLALSCAAPAARQLDARKQLRPPIARALDRAYPLPNPPSPTTLAFLVAQAEAALEREGAARFQRAAKRDHRA